MPENTRTQMQSVSYETVAEAFSEEAKSLISDSAIQEILGTEKYALKMLPFSNSLQKNWQATI